MGRVATDANRFWRLVEKTDECWLWRGRVGDHGYGVVSVKWKDWRAHRYAFFLTFGAIPPGLFVCHRCDHPLCVRPDHLFLATHADNMADMTAKARQGSGTTVGAARLSELLVLALRAHHDVGAYTQRDLAAMFGVTQPNVGRALRGESWRHIL